MYSECEDEVPQDILEKANVVSLNLLPLKSREKYEKEYQLFTCWMETRQIRTSRSCSWAWPKRQSQTAIFPRNGLV